MASVRNWWIFRSLGQHSLNNNYLLIEACLIGVISGLAALFLKQGIGFVGGYRVILSRQYGAWLILPLFGVVCGWFAGYLLETFAPEAKGGGVPQVKVVLAQFPLPLNWKVALAKSIGTILVLGGGLTLGRRGPSVHIGAALAAQLSQWLPTTPNHRRQMIAAGAAAGLAAGFNTPIAGVLFVVEELMRDMSGLTLETAIVASFTGSVVSRWFGTSDLNLPAELLNAANQSNFYLAEIPWYLLLGGLAGVLGALFNRGILTVLGFNRRLRLSLGVRMAIAGAISGTVVAFLPPFFRDNAGLRDFLLTGDAGWQVIAIAFVAHFFLSLIAYGSGAPGGLFAPTLVLGTALGYLVGTCAEIFVPEATQYTYALAGMGAFFTGVARVPVTAIVIVFELTTDFNLVLPLMLASVTALIVAESIFKGSIYEYLLEASGIHLEEEKNPQVLTDLTAAQVMQPEVETLESHLNLKDLVPILSESPHRGFPVLKQGKLVGIVTQGDLAQMAAQGKNLTVAQVMQRKVITVSPRASLSDVLYLLNRYQISRLPVVDNDQLQGIITRSDIIRAEAQELLGKSHHAVQRTPSYCVYQTHTSDNYKRKLWVAIANPNTAEALITFAAAIAKEKNAMVYCLNVVQVAATYPLTDAHMNTYPERHLMEKLERLGETLGISIHTQVILAYDVAGAILQEISSKDQGLILGWQGDRHPRGQLFGSVMEYLVKKVPCDVILVKTSHAHPLQFKAQPGKIRALVPIAGGPNAERAQEFIPALLHLSPEVVRYSLPSQICLCQVYQPQQRPQHFPLLVQAKRGLDPLVEIPIIPLPIRSSHIADSLIRLIKEETYDLVILGASRESLFQKALHGNIPEAIAKGTNRTVVIIRGALDVTDPE
ncbi:chloride channel protein [Picosynechococcus sp. PCC 7117]|uniref:chloride channel protein n=1 Tax=Picosynechococcus sp. PCC 7117 TaxID=195498 RepID=UPI0008109378|nr:chloride channel protein [Picosynechococcus sp. PCC 7117]ANV86504.1 chloride channel protein [Picosynechococcus sp. PCC 7117]